MPPIVRLALWYRLLGSEWICPECGRAWIGGYGAHHIVQSHPWSYFAKSEWVRWFDEQVAVLWA